MSLIETRLLASQAEGLSLTRRLHKVADCLDRDFENVAWNSLDINYHPPRVERLWAQFGTMRLMIHRIQSMQDPQDALFHPHPWPSAVLILDGMYKMGIGYGESAEPPPVAATITLQSGSSYEMTDKNAWHYVAPCGGYSTSLMLIDSPWDEPHPFYTEGEKVRLNPLTERQREGVIRAMRAGLQEWERG